MTRYYEGKREDGGWEKFGWDEVNEPTLETTGYEMVRPLGKDSQ